MPSENQFQPLQTLSEHVSGAECAVFFSPCAYVFFGIPLTAPFPPRGDLPLNPLHFYALGRYCISSKSITFISRGLVLQQVVQQNVRRLGVSRCHGFVLRFSI